MSNNLESEAVGEIADGCARARYRHIDVIYVGNVVAELVQRRQGGYLVSVLRNGLNARMDELTQLKTSNGAP